MAELQMTADDPAANRRVRSEWLRRPDWSSAPPGANNIVGAREWGSAWKVG